MALIVFAGLPGVGKTTIARALAAAENATFLRIDAIEQTLREATGAGRDVGAAGYRVAYALARANLAAGRAVVADCVNPARITREAWRDVAAQAHAPLLEVEIVCSDPREHRRRVETRVSDIAGLVLPRWADVAAREYEPWDRERLVLDAATLHPQAALARIAARLRDIERA